MMLKSTEIKKKQNLKNSVSPSKEIQPYVFLIGLGIIVFICYSNSFSNEFVFDDHALVFQSQISSLREFILLLKYSYRPLRSASYALDFLLWGNRPFGFHVTNFLIHLINTFLVFVVIKTISARNLVAFLASLIFAVHPIQTDAVTYISGRRDILFTLFYLAAFYSYLNFRKTKSILWLTGFIFCWGLSLLSKEMAASLPLVIFIWNYCNQFQNADGSGFRRFFQTLINTIKIDKWFYLILLIAAIGYAYYMIFYKLSSGRLNANGVYFWGGSFFATILTSIRIHGWYLKQLIFPTPIAQYLGAFEPSTSLLDWRFILSAIFILTILTGAIISLKKNRLFTFAIFSFFAILAPVSQVLPHHELLADHYLYLPMLSFGLFFGLIVDWLVKEKPGTLKVIYAGVTAIILFFCMTTILRNKDWENDLTLWQATYNSVPQSPRAAYNLGGLLQRSNPQRAEQLLKQAVTSDPDFEFGYLALARFYLTQKRVNEAEETARKGLLLLESGKGSFIARNRPLLTSQLTVVIAGVEWEKGNVQKAEEVMRKAIASYPQNKDAYLGLANFYAAKDRLKELEILQQGLHINRGAYDLQARLASVLLDLGRVDDSLQALRLLAEMEAKENDCQKAYPYIESIKTNVSKNPGLRQFSQELQKAEESCRR